MHSIATIKSADGAASYYGKDDFASAEYYSGDNAAAYSEWDGGAAAAAGVSGEVTKSDLGKILNGQLASGETVAKYDGRRPGYDLTFSAPKSVSIMALVAGDKRLLGPDGAHTKAVRQTMAWIEKNLVETRKDIDGKKVPIRADSMLYALVQHDTSRALDPQLHIHALVANLVKMADGKWQALHADKIWANNSVIGSVYHSFLRDEVEKLGYQTEVRGKHGTFELSGVPKELIDSNSTRRAQILKVADERGITSPQGLRSITARTRDPKLTLDDREKLTADWRDSAAAMGFDGRKLVDAATRAATHRETAGLIDRTIGAISDAVQSARELFTKVASTNDPFVDKAIVRWSGSVQAAMAQFAVASAVRTLGEREAAFDKHQLAKTALDFALRGATVHHVTARINKLIERGTLIEGKSNRNNASFDMVTTKGELAKEERILALMEAGKGQATPVIPAKDGAERVQTASLHELNPGQLAAATLIVSSSDRVVVVQGVAGGGKSTMMKAVSQTFEVAGRLAESQGQRLHGLAFQSQMVADLKNDAGVEAQTIDSFIWQNRDILENPSSPSAQAKRGSLAGVILGVDEGSMVSNDQMLKLIELSDALGAEKLAVIGDRKQLASIGSGKAFSLLQAGGAAIARMDQNLRQQTPLLRTVAALANRGQASAALRALGDMVIEHETPADHAAEMWLSLSPEDRAGTAVFASGRAVRAGINLRIQEGLAAEGSLKGDAQVFTVQETVNLAREELRYTKSYKAGMLLEVRGRIPELGLERGTFRISRVLANGKVQLEQHGRKRTIDPRRLDPTISRDRLELSSTKEIKLHEGDKIRWTDKDADRALMRSSVARVLSIDEKGVTVETAARETLTLAHGDRMLARMDLAYSLNMHMAQGITVDKGITVMLSHERNLSNQQLFNVGVTRIRSELSFVVDNQAKLEQQLDRTTGNKISATEVTGRLNIDGPCSKGTVGGELGAAGFNPVPRMSGPIDPLDPIGRTNFSDVPPLPSSSEEGGKRYAKDEYSLSRRLGPTDLPASKEGQKESMPERNLGLEM